MSSNPEVVPMKWFRFAAVLLIPGLAVAQPVPLPDAPARSVRMQRSADIERVLIGRNGEPFALLLAEGSVVMLPPHLAVELYFAPGQRVQVEGDAVQTGLNVVYFRVRLTRNGKMLLPADPPPPGGAPAHGGPGPEADRGTELDAQGSLEALLAAPDGRVTGLVFADGTVASIGRDEVIDVSGLTRGMRLDVSGPGTVRQGVATLRLERLMLPNGTLRTVQSVAALSRGQP
jgi:hypothetical protein